MVKLKGGLLLSALVIAAGCGGPPEAEDAAAPAAGADTTAAVPRLPMEPPPADPTAVRPFEIHVPDAVLDDLRDRLQRARLPDELDDAGWDYGTPLGYLTELVTYWRDEFDWREQEAALNAFDHFKTQIDGIDVHFIHQRSPDPDALPLLITHGWPGTVVEFMEIIGPLTDPAAHGGRAADAFHVIAPSIPGYGFSGHPRERGFGPESAAAVNAALMERLGYDRYGLQGGDWGAIISRWHAYNRAEAVVGLHLNMLIAGPPPGVEDPTAGVPQAELARMQERTAFFQGPETGYSHIQGTKPQTLGYGLNDSPVGQAAWIVEKFRTWCDCDGHPENIFSRDALLTNIMLYWLTESATSSARMYYESGLARATGAGQPGRIEVPTGGAIFPHELFYTPRAWAEAHYNLVRWTEMPRGGHFAAMEQPELFIDDVRAFFADLR